MKRLLFILALTLTLVACNRHSEHWTTITDMERIIEERPDSVLNVLQAIDTDELIGDEERAKHALLLSMALDKNVIDKTDFEVLQPAIDYYKDNGSATDKMRTYYYQARIYQNADNNAAAMECFVKAISEGSQSDDTLTKARIHFAQSDIYYDLYDFDNYIKGNLSAASYFKQAERHKSYANCLIRVINGYTLLDDFDGALPYVEECKQLKDIMRFASLCDYYSSYITYLENCGANAELKDTIEEYFNTIPVDNIDWLVLANAYIRLGQYEEALQALEQYKNSGKTSEDTKYKVLKSIIYEKLERHEEALRAYKEYMVVSDSTLYAISSGEYWIEINIRDVNSPDTWDVETVTLEDIVEGCKDFDHEALAANIAGEWVLDTWVVYDDEWSYIALPLIVKGTHYTLGLEGGESFTFAADGTGTNYENYENSGTGALTTRFNWVYDVESSRLTCSGEYNLEWTVTGFSDEYIVLDRLDFDGDNIRTILKRKK